MALQIIRPTEPKFSYTLKDGTVIKYDDASDLGEASVEFNFCNPYEPMTFEYDWFIAGRAHAKAKKKVVAS